MTNFKLQQNSVNKILNQYAFFSLLRCVTWYNNAIYILFTYFASFIGFEDDIVEGISNLNVQKAKFGGKGRIWWKIY